MNERIDSDLPESLRRVVQEYHPPPDTPRDAMWARIVAARSAQPTAEESPNALPFRPAARRRLVVWGVGIAAALLVAFGLGRRSVGTASNGGVATPTIAAEAPSLALRLAAADHLARTETFLTMLRTDAL